MGINFCTPLPLYEYFQAICISPRLLAALALVKTAKSLSALKLLFPLSYASYCSLKSLNKNITLICCYVGGSWPNLGVEKWKICDTHPHTLECLDCDLSANWCASRLDFAYCYAYILLLKVESSNYTFAESVISWSFHKHMQLGRSGTFQMQWWWPTRDLSSQISHRMNAVNFTLLLFVSLTHISLANNSNFPRLLLRQRSQRTRGKL